MRSLQRTLKVRTARDQEAAALRDQGDEIPIIVVSGWVDDETIANQPDCVHAVLKKPIQREHLLKTIDLALNK